MLILKVSEVFADNELYAIKNMNSILKLILGQSVKFISMFIKFQLYDINNRISCIILLFHITLLF